MMKQFLTLKSFFIQHRWQYIWGVLWLFGLDLLQLLTPQVLRLFTDKLVNNTITYRHLLWYGLMLIGIALLIVLCRYMWRMHVLGAARLLEFDLRNRLYGHFQTLSANYYNHHKIGDLMARATNDITAVRASVGMGVMMLVDTVVLLSASVLAMIVTVDWRLTVAALLPLPLMTIMTNRLGRLVHIRFKAAQDSFGRLTERVQENLSGMRVIKSFAQEEAEIEKFEQANRTNLERNMRVAHIQAIYTPVVQFISGLSFLVVIGYGGMMVMQNRITLGEFVAFNSYLGLAIWPMRAIGQVINVLQRGSASLARINEILAVQPEIADHPQTTQPVSTLRGEIRVNGLTFQYPGSGHPALQGVSFHLKPGQTLGIVGRTGSGKSTLANLLVRIYEADPGMILIDGLPINRIPLETLRKSIGYVPQEPFLFSQTIAENIAFGKEGASREEIIEAAGMAHILHDIQSFPNQFDTLVGERGVTLSGGQKQRIAIARALIKNPPILILDDSLSAVDAKTEEAILRHLAAVRKGRTNLIIAHRISSIKNADCILVLDQGKVAAAGTHHQLLAEQGLYADLYRKQLLDRQLQEEGGKRDVRTEG